MLSVFLLFLIQMIERKNLERTEYLLLSYFINFIKLILILYTQSSSFIQSSIFVLNNDLPANLYKVFQAFSFK